MVISVAVIIISEYSRHVRRTPARLTVSAATVQGWSSVIPKFSAVDFVSFYIEIPVLIVMYVGYMLVRRPGPSSAQTALPTGTEAVPQHRSVPRRVWNVLTYNDQVDVKTVDLRRDEYHEAAEDIADNTQREAKFHGRWRWFWKVYYAVV